MGRPPRRRALVLVGPGRRRPVLRGGHPPPPRPARRHALPAATRLALRHAAEHGRGGRGCLIVFAAGNGNEPVGVDEYASNPYVIAVGSTNRRDRRAAYSDYGPALFCCFPSSDVRVVADELRTVGGVTVADRLGELGYDPTDYFHAFGGTSAAAPAVAGVAALVLEIAPALTRDQLRDLLRVACTLPGRPPGSRDDELGYGILDALTAVLLARRLRGYAHDEVEAPLRRLLALQPDLRAPDAPPADALSVAAPPADARPPLPRSPTPPSPMSPPQQARAYSLHFGVNVVDPGAYPGQYVPDLRGCVRDARDWAAFAKTRGFAVTPPFVADGRQRGDATRATRENFKAQMAAFAETCRPGDLLLVTYAGHGSQVKTTDPQESDRFDETWLLYDGILLDDEVDLACKDFAAGVRIVIVADSCHSGTSTRNVVMLEPAQVVPRDAGPDVVIERRVPEAVARSNYRANRADFEAIKAERRRRPRTAAYVKLLAGCRDGETSKEVRGRGVFSSTLLGVLAEDPSLDYEAACAEVRGRVAREYDQRPGVFDSGAFSDAFDGQAALTIAPPDGIRMDGFGESPTGATGDDAAGATGDTAFQDEPRPGRPPSYAAFLDEPAPADAHLVVGGAERDLRLAGLDGDEARRSLLFDGQRALPRGLTQEPLYSAAYRLLAANPDADVEYVEVDVPVEVSRYRAPRGAGDDCARESNPDETLDFLHCRPTPPLDLDDREVWYLGDDYSQLRRASLVACPQLEYGVAPPWAPGVPHVAMLDTGVLWDYPVRPPNLDRDGARSFLRGERDRVGAADRALPEQQGHGMATANLLAGGKMRAGLFAGGVESDYRGWVGAAPQVRVTPLRIGESVVILRGRRFAEALRYAVRSLRVDVVSMSMAGAPSHRMAAAVNEAYEAGVVVVTAAGNSWTEGFRKYLPEATMYPARFDRVVSAVGVNAHGKPYIVDQARFDGLYGGERSAGGAVMQGCFGPADANATALAGYTPNTLWLGGDRRPGTKSEDPYATMSGGGTSSATPQIAAAAALYLQVHGEELDAAIAAFAKTRGTPPRDERWRRAEAVRQALFRGARKDQPAEILEKYFGNGALRAFEALRYRPFSSGAGGAPTDGKTLPDGTAYVLHGSDALDVDRLAKAKPARLGFSALDDAARLLLSFRGAFLRRSRGGEAVTTPTRAADAKLWGAVARTLVAEVYHHLYAEEGLARFRAHPFTAELELDRELARGLLQLDGDISEELRGYLMLRVGEGVQDAAAGGEGGAKRGVPTASEFAEVIPPLDGRAGVGVLVDSATVRTRLSVTETADYDDVRDLLYQEVTIEVNPGEARGVGSRDRLTVTVDPAAGLAATLVEVFDEDGELVDVYWQLPTRAEVLAARRGGGGEGGAPGGQWGGGQRFAIDLGAMQARARGRGRTRRRIAKLIGRVFSWRDREGKVRDGKVGKELAGRYLNLLVDPEARDPEGRFARAVETGKLGRALAGDGPILLLLHGTYNNARGSFRELASREAFWARAKRRYGGRMVAFEMPTLVHGVERNTRELLKLKRAFGKRPIDIISTSRGGLVARDFAMRKDVNVGRMAMIAGTHFGTPMAELDNLTHLIQQSTRLVKVAGGPIGTTLGTLVKLVDALVTGVMALPGLEAQDPDNAYLRDLNARWGFDRPGHLYVGADFEPRGKWGRVFDGARDFAVFRGADNDGITGTNGALGLGEDLAVGTGARRLRLGAGSGVGHSGYWGEEGVVRGVGDVLWGVA